MKLLLIDDSPTIQRAVEIALQGEGCDIQWIDEPSELQTALTAPPAYDICLIDFNFPGVDVYDALKRLSATGTGRRHLLVCGTLDQPDAGKTSAIEKFSILRKPFDRKALLAAIREDKSVAPAEALHPEVKFIGQARKADLKPQGTTTAPTVNHKKGTPPIVPQAAPLSVKNLDQHVYDELRGATKTAVPPAEPVSVDHIDDRPLTIEFTDVNYQNEKKLPKNPMKKAEMNWPKIEEMVQARLSAYCSQWVPQYLNRTLREIIQDEMKQMDDTQWTQVLTKALRDVVQTQFLDIAEKMIRQELNQLLKEDLAMTPPPPPQRT